MAAYRRVYDSRHLQADCQEPGSAPGPYARQSSTGSLYLSLQFDLFDIALVQPRAHAFDTDAKSCRRYFLMLLTYCVSPID